MALEFISYTNEKSSKQVSMDAGKELCARSMKLDILTMKN